MHDIRRICVYAGSTPGADPAYMAAARDLGAALARHGIGLVYGGGRRGLMGAVADAAMAEGGEVTGVIPESLHARELAHTGLTELRVVSSMHERKAAMAERSDAFIALPGGLGTLEEVIEIATWTQLGLHAKPVGLLDTGGFWSHLHHLLAHLRHERFIRDDPAGFILRSPSAGELIGRLTSWGRASATADAAAVSGVSGGAAVSGGAGGSATTIGAAGTAGAADGTGAADGARRPRGPLLGTSAVVVRGECVLLGRRRGAHGAGTWSFPGGKVDPGESPADAAARELKEETGLHASRVEPIAWTDDVFTDEGLHYVTLHHLVEAVGEPVEREPDKVDRWEWHPWHALPEPLFAPVRALMSTGWAPPG